MERRRYREDDRALYCARTVSGLTTREIHAQRCAEHEPRPPSTLDFGHMRHISREDKLESDAAPSPLGNDARAGFFGGKLQDGLGAGGSCREEAADRNWICSLTPRVR